MGNISSVSRTIIQRMHSSGADINSEVADNGATLLHLATALEDKEAIKELLDNGASVSVADRSGQLPLHLSLSTSNAECAEMLLEAHIKEETERLKDSLRRSSELAALCPCDADLTNNNNNTRPDVNMNLSVLDGDALFESYHSTGSAAETRDEDNESDDLDRSIPDMDEYSTRSVVDADIYDTQTVPEIVVENCRPVHTPSAAMPIKGNSTASDMAMSGSLKLDDFTVLSVSNSLTDPSQLDSAMNQKPGHSTDLALTRVKDVARTDECDTPNTGRARRFQSWVASFFSQSATAPHSASPPTVAHTIQLAADLELVRSQLGELKHVHGDLQQMRTLLDQYKTVLASLTVDQVLAHSIRHSPPNPAPITHYVSPVPMTPVTDEPDTAAQAPPPPPPPPGSGPAPVCAKPKGPQPLTPEQLCKAVSELIAQGDCEAANVPKVAANYYKVMLGEDNGLKRLARLVSHYPRVIQGAPLKPKSASKIVDLYEDELISRLEQNDSYTAKEIDDARRAKQTLIVKTVKELKEWSQIEERIKQDIADTFKTLEWKKKQKQLEEEQKKNKNMLTSVIDELASLHKRKETETAAVRAEQELMDMETD